MWWQQQIFFSSVAAIVDRAVCHASTATLFSEIVPDRACFSIAVMCMFPKNSTCILSLCLAWLSICAACDPL